MNRPTKPIRQQRGQVAIIVAIVIGLLILMIGLVVDLGFLYTRKTELQNAADAAALAGAKELNGKASGITAAKQAAVDMAALNSVYFGKEPVEITPGQVCFASTPDGNADGNWSCGTLSDAEAADKFFVRVDTVGAPLSTVQTWFMHIAGPAFANTSTFGMAVAGTYAAKVLPIAACALDAADCATGNCGYELGKAYPLSKINPIGPGTIFWIDPTATQAGQCDGSTPRTLPFICQGEISAAVATAPQVFTNTGVSTPQLEALDSRFGLYAPQAKCDTATAPPDLNIKRYYYNQTTWMEIDPPVYQTDKPEVFNNCINPPNPFKCQAAQVARTATGYEVDHGGVVWSFVRPQSGTPLATARAVEDPPNYPAEGTPYTNRTDAAFYQNPQTTPGVNLPGARDRRVLNMLIVNCPSAGGQCRSADVLGVGRFFLQRPATDPPQDKEIYIEFGGMTFAGPPLSEIRLYR